MDSHSLEVAPHASAVEAGPAPVRRNPPVRTLAVLGLLAGFVTGVVLNFQAESTARELAAARSAPALQYSQTVAEAAAEYLPMLAED